MEEIIELTTRIPKWLHKILKEIKEKTGQSINNQLIVNTIRQNVSLGIISVNEIRTKIKKSQNDVKMMPTQPIPENLKYCSSESCEVPINLKKMEVKNYEKTKNE